MSENMRKIIFTTSSEVQYDNLEPSQDYNRIYIMPKTSSQTGRVVCWDIINKGYFTINKFREVQCIMKTELEDVLKLYIETYGCTAFLCDSPQDAWEKLMSDARE